MNKFLREMAEEVHENNVLHGWYNEERTEGEMVALLHSEISEALEAYREWGLKDMTGTGPSLSKGIMDPAANWYVPKPEGVGSEFADVLIRLLDDAYRKGIDLDAEVANSIGKFAINVRFGDNITALHMDASRIMHSYEDQWNLGINDLGHRYAAMFTRLTQLCEFYRIDLEVEYERKMRYNRLRSYRHGGKAL